MVLLVTDVFLLLTQVLLWILVGLAARFVLLKALPKAFLGGLVLVLLVAVTALTFFKGAPETGLHSLWLCGSHQRLTNRASPAPTPN